MRLFLWLKRKGTEKGRGWRGGEDRQRGKGRQQQAHSQLFPDMSWQTRSVLECRPATSALLADQEHLQDRVSQSQISRQRDEKREEHGFRFLFCVICWGEVITADFFFCGNGELSLQEHAAIH